MSADDSSLHFTDDFSFASSSSPSFSFNNNQHSHSQGGPTPLASRPTIITPTTTVTTTVIAASTINNNNNKNKNTNAISNNGQKGSSSSHPLSTTQATSTHIVMKSDGGAEETKKERSLPSSTAAGSTALHQAGPTSASIGSVNVVQTTKVTHRPVTAGPIDDADNDDGDDDELEDFSFSQTSPSHSSSPSISPIRSSEPRQKEDNAGALVVSKENNNNDVGNAKIQNTGIVGVGGRLERRGRSGGEENTQSSERLTNSKEGEEKVIIQDHHQPHADEAPSTVTRANSSSLCTTRTTSTTSVSASAITGEQKSISTMAPPLLPCDAMHATSTDDDNNNNINNNHHHEGANVVLVNVGDLFQQSSRGTSVASSQQEGRYASPNNNTYSYNSSSTPAAIPPKQPVVDGSFIFSNGVPQRDGSDLFLPPPSSPAARPTTARPASPSPSPHQKDTSAATATLKTSTTMTTTRGERDGAGEGEGGKTTVTATPAVTTAVDTISSPHNTTTLVLRTSSQHSDSATGTAAYASPNPKQTISRRGRPKNSEDDDDDISTSESENRTNTDPTELEADTEEKCGEAAATAAEDRILPAANIDNNQNKGTSSSSSSVLKSLLALAASSNQTAEEFLRNEHMFLEFINGLQEGEASSRLGIEKEEERSYLKKIVRAFEEESELISEKIALRELNAAEERWRSETEATHAKERNEIEFVELTAVLTALYQDENESFRALYGGASKELRDYFDRKAVEDEEWQQRKMEINDPFPTISAQLLNWHQTEKLRILSASVEMEEEECRKVSLTVPEKEQWSLLSIKLKKRLSHIATREAVYAERTSTWKIKGFLSEVHKTQQIDLCDVREVKMRSIIAQSERSERHAIRRDFQTFITKQRVFEEERQHERDLFEIRSQYIQEEIEELIAEEAVVRTNTILAAEELVFRSKCYVFLRDLNVLKLFLCEKEELRSRQSMVLREYAFGYAIDDDNEIGEGEGYDDDDDNENESNEVGSREKKKGVENSSFHTALIGQKIRDNAGRSLPASAAVELLPLKREGLVVNTIRDRHKGKKRKMSSSGRSTSVDGCLGSSDRGLDNVVFSGIAGVYQLWQDLQFHCFSEYTENLRELFDSEAFVISHFEKSFKDLIQLESMQRKMLAITENTARCDNFFVEEFSMTSPAAAAAIVTNARPPTQTLREHVPLATAKVTVPPRQYYSHRYACEKAIAKFYENETIFRKGVEKEFKHSCWTIEKKAKRLNLQAAESVASRALFLKSFAAKIKATLGEEEGDAGSQNDLRIPLSTLAPATSAVIAPRPPHRTASVRVSSSSSSLSGPSLSRRRYSGNDHTDETGIGHNKLKKEETLTTVAQFPDSVDEEDSSAPGDFMRNFRPAGYLRRVHDALASAKATANSGMDVQDHLLTSTTSIPLPLRTPAPPPPRASTQTFTQLASIIERDELMRRMQIVVDGRDAEFSQLWPKFMTEKSEIEKGEGETRRHRAVCTKEMKGGNKSEEFVAADGSIVPHTRGHNKDTITAAAAGEKGAPPPDMYVSSLLPNPHF